MHVGISIDWSIDACPYDQAKDTFVCLSHPNKSDDDLESASTNANWLDSTSMCNGTNGLRDETIYSKTLQWFGKCNKKTQMVRKSNLGGGEGL